MFVVNLLLVSPHPVGRAWTESTDEADWRRALEQVPLSDAAKKAALIRMKLLSAFRDQAADIANVLMREAYGGMEPHPSVTDTSKLILAAQTLDQQLPSQSHVRELVPTAARETPLR